MFQPFAFQGNAFQIQSDIAVEPGFVEYELNLGDELSLGVGLQWRPISRSTLSEKVV